MLLSIPVQLQIRQQKNSQRCQEKPFLWLPASSSSFGALLPRVALAQVDLSEPVLSWPPPPKLFRSVPPQPVPRCLVSPESETVSVFRRPHHLYPKSWRPKLEQGQSRHRYRCASSHLLSRRCRRGAPSLCLRAASYFYLLYCCEAGRALAHPSDFAASFSGHSEVGERIVAQALAHRHPWVDQKPKSRRPAR